MEEHHGQRRDALLEQLLDLSHEERAALLAEACADDPKLRAKSA